MIATPLDALTALHVDMAREFHHNRVDMPVSVNLDDWLVRIAAIIDALSATVSTHESQDTDRRVKAAFVEGYNTMRRQYHLEDELDLAWEQSVSKRMLT